MKKTAIAMALALICLGGSTGQAVTINLTAAYIQESDGSPLAAGSTLMLVASTLDADFGNLESLNLADPNAFANETDDIVLARWGLDAVAGDGSTLHPINFDLGGDLSGGDPLLFVWYSGLQESGAPAAPGEGRWFGTYRTNDVVDGSSSGWFVPGDNGATIDLNFLTVSGGGSIPDIAGLADQQTMMPIPEPSTYGMFLIGGLALLGFLRKRAEALA
jgi:hypothetical protein